MIDETGLKILTILQDKARIPNVEVARKIGMAPSAVLERIRKLEKQGIIDGYEVRLNPERFKRSLVAFVYIQTDMQAGQKTVGPALAKLPEVQEVHFVAGEDSFLIKVRVADTTDLQQFLEKKNTGDEGGSFDSHQHCSDNRKRNVSNTAGGKQFPVF